MGKKKQIRKKGQQKKKSGFLSLIILLIIVVLSYVDIEGINFFNLWDNSTQNVTSQPGENPGPIDNGIATFTDDDLRDSIDGWIHYGKLDSLGRPTTADALIKPNMIGTGSSALQSIKPPGFISGLDPNNHARGHLIGRQLGGSGEEEKNLVTLYQNPVNTPYMTKYENMVRQAADDGLTIRYRVKPVYEGNVLMPVAVQMQAKSLDNPTIDFNVTIENKK